MDSQTLEQLRGALVSSLKGISRSTEEVYLRMGDVYPALVAELDTGLKMSEGVGAAQESLVRATSQALRLIEDRDSAISANLQGTRSRLAELDRQIGQLETLESGVALIRDDSSLMKLLSLNAMVIAAKAGNPGRAFSCISDELQRTSHQTLELTNRVDQGQKALVRSFEEFTASLVDLNEESTTGISDFMSRVKEIFAGLNQGSEDLVVQLDSLRAQTAEVKGPLVSIMVEIQNQDRIRQGLDHVISTIEELVWDEGGGALEVQLSNLSYLEVLPELCRLVLEEVQDQIRHNREVFTCSLQTARGVVQNLQAQRASLVRSQEPGAALGLDHWLALGEQQFSAFDEHTQALGRRQDLALRTTSVLRRTARSLVESLQSFDTILARFRSVGLAARIQIGRHASLSSMQGNATEMTSLTQRMESHMTRCIGVIASFFGAAEGVFRSFQDESAVQADQDQAFRQGLSEALSRLREAKGALDESLDDSEVFSAAFLDQFSLTDADLEILDQLLDEMDKKKKRLEDLKAQVSRIKQDLLAAAGLSDWKLPEGRLQTLVGRFTIFRHKAFAARWADLEIGSATEAGEVTLF